MQRAVEAMDELLRGGNPKESADDVAERIPLPGRRPARGPTRASGGRGATTIPQDAAEGVHVASAGRNGPSWKPDGKILKKKAVPVQGTLFCEENKDMEAMTTTPPPPTQLFRDTLRLETAHQLVKVAQKLEGTERDAVLAATKAYLRNCIHKKRNMESRKARGLPVWGNPPFTTPPAVAEALGLDEKKETE
jgi:hypothetical protein